MNNRDAPLVRKRCDHVAVLEQRQPAALTSKHRRMFVPIVEPKSISNIVPGLLLVFGRSDPLRTVSSIIVISCFKDVSGPNLPDVCSSARIANGEGQYDRRLSLRQIGTGAWERDRYPPPRPVPGASARALTKRVRRPLALPPRHRIACSRHSSHSHRWLHQDQWDEASL